MFEKNKGERISPMLLMERLAEYYKERIIVDVDVDYKICVHINNIDRIYKKKYLSNLEGRGYTYEDACIDYIKNLMDRKYNIRYNSKFYATNSLRTIVRKSNYKEG